MAFGDYPTNEQRTIPYKLIGIIGGGIVLAVVVVGVVIRFVNKTPDPITLIQQEQKPETLLEKCIEAPNPEACRQSFLRSSLQEMSGADVCESFEEKEKDGCYWQFAVEKNDPTLCKSMVNEANKKLCLNMAIFEKAKAESDASQCVTIEDEIAKSLCVHYFEPPLTSTNCLSLGRDANYCKMYEVSDRARLAQDSAVCTELSEEEGRAGCEELIVLDDPDFDGLATDTEELYGSNPRNPDSDADGYKDGDEVAAGFNPAGPGKLEIKTAPPEPFVLPF